MKKLKILIYHFVIFVVGSIGIVAYIFQHLASKKGVAGVGGTIAMPAIALVYVCAFSILCLISLFIWLFISHFSHKKKFKKIVI